MIRIEIVLASKGTLKSLSAEGHAYWDIRGRDIVCAAATVVLRTAAGLLFSEPGVITKGAQSGATDSMKIRVEKSPEHKRQWLRGITDFLIKGLLDLEKEFPQNMEIAIIEETRAEE